jgi:hypothetical protein
MAALHSTAASLRFRGDDLEPDAITRLLGAEPSHANRNGDRRRSKRSGQEYAPYRTAGWSLQALDREPGDLDGQVVEILLELTNDLAAWAQLSAYKPELFCGLFMKGGNEGLTISSETLKMLADRGIEIGLDVYGPARKSSLSSDDPAH